MDIDLPAAPSPAQPIRRIVVGESSPYDLEQLANTWEGRSKVNRLLFIASSTPSLAGPALTLALSSIKHLTLDTNLYQEVFQHYRQFINSIEEGKEQDPGAVSWYGSVKGREEGLDRNWLESAKKEASSGKEKLEVELRGYTTNLIKESIRMGYRDLARFQYRCGELQDAVRSYTKSREYCTTSQHVLDMCLGVIEIALDMNNYAFVRNYVVKAESAIDAAAQSSSTGSKPKQTPVLLPGMVAPAQDPIEAAKERERKIIQERLTVAGGVAHLGAGSFEKAAFAFTDLGSEAINSGTSHFIPGGDIALYAVLTSLACFDRVQLRTRVLENSNLRPFLDIEPYLREIVRAFYDSKFKLGLELLSKHEHRPLLDIHLASHVPSLLRQIRQRALLAYFQPFGSVSLSRMASAFGIDAQQSSNVLLPELIELIERGSLKARIDSAKGTLVAKKKDSRGEAFRNALEQGEKLQKKAMASQLRMKLLRNDVLVKASRANQQQQQQQLVLDDD
ncbi:COP9 signalosome complex subunit 1 [Sporobolomyces salmoneus]|uniref:COP9 signalosome complex subunit 1 n=1 Tax=Sporobolomyces salmoneus TaxID=183962 RepID=UPI00317131B6